MHMPISLTRDLVLIGGGHAHALVLRMWGMKPLAGVRLTLINPGPTAPYSGMLPGHIAGHYTRDELDIDLVKLARFSGARLILSPATAIDPVRKTVTVQGRGDIGYDIASLDVGIHAEMPNVTGFAEHAIGAKPLDRYAEAWRVFLERAATAGGTAKVAVIGGGVAGAELSLAMAQALRARGCTPDVSVIEAGPEITGQTRAAQSSLLRAMQELGVTPLTGATVAAIEADGVRLEDGRFIASDFTVGAAGAFAHGWLASAPLPLTEDGFVRVGDTLQVEGHPDLFAVGDCAYLSNDPRPKAGVFAVRAAPVLLGNLSAALAGGQMSPFRPQKDYLKLVSLGGKSALAEKWGRTLTGPALWRWKDRIDCKFMDRFRDLPKMPAPDLPTRRALDDTPDPQPLCGGCGSKVGPGTLSAALHEMPRSGRPDVLSGPGDDAAVLQVGGQTQVLTTDHLRAFTEDFGLLARISAVHALGDIWAMGAAPQSAMLSVILPRMSEPLQARSMAEILSNAGEVLRGAGAEIVGGHSTMGAELTIGLSLTGLVDNKAITNAGACAGDALILTRPLGSGTLLAAEMQGKAEGDDIAALLQIMARPQGDAADILQDARAMTDVTGFGLAGHLMAICSASGVAAVIDPDAIPLYSGAERLAAQGHRSTIFAANRDAAPVFGAEGARAALLHDPQTAGGLLASVEAGKAEGLLARLRRAGHNASIIGRITEGAPSISCGTV